MMCHQIKGKTEGKENKNGPLSAAANQWQTEVLVFGF